MDKHLEKKQIKQVLDLLVEKYQADSTTFEFYLPEVAVHLQRMMPARGKKGGRSILTAPERESLQKDLKGLLGKKNLSCEEAVRFLEICAILVQAASLPSEVRRQIIANTVRQVTGVPLSNISKKIEYALGKGEAEKRVSLLRGVYLHLTWDYQLLAISVLPERAKERTTAMRFVGVGKDIAQDVAEHHDAYILEALSLGNR